MKRSVLALCLLFTALCLVGCGKPRVDLNVASQPNVNPDNTDRPSPVLVKVYELRNDLAFKQADFQSLFERPVPTLGADLLAADDMVFIPGEARKVAYKPLPNTRFLGVVAGFRQMERAQWRIIKAINPEEKNIVALEFNDTSILVIPDKEAKNWDPEAAVKDFQQRMVRPASQPNAQTQVTPAQTEAQNAPPTGQSGQAARQSERAALGAQPSSSSDTTQDKVGQVVTTVRDNIPVDDLAKQGVSRALSTPSSAPTPSVSPVRIMSPL